MGEPPAAVDPAITDPIPAWSLDDLDRVAGRALPQWPAEITREWAWGARRPMGFGSA